MAKYRKKPIVVDAVQWHRHGDHPAVLAYGESTLDRFPAYSVCGFIETPEGNMNVTPGCWVVGPGAAGEFWAVQPSIFEATYEKVPEGGYDKP